MTTPPDDAVSPDSEVRSCLAALGLVAASVTPLAGDASTRRYFRVRLVGGDSVVAALYGSADEAQAGRDVGVQRWAWRAGLPVPAPVAATGRLVLSADLGSEDAEAALRLGQEGLLARVGDCLEAFQAVPWEGAPNPPFDAAVFRRELAGFERQFVIPGGESSAELGGFLDDLAASLAVHPYRLTHRDFHLNNLFSSGGRVWAIDYQDLRGGPDTYDAASLLFERAAPELIANPVSWAEATAARCGWPGDWWRRLVQSRAQRGLKVLGTFARLAVERRAVAYARWLPVAREQTAEALRTLAPPPVLQEILATPHPAERL